jgi:uncharacterized NAD(P)/FAD-binding protein YdhS
MKIEEGRWVAKNLDGVERRFRTSGEADAWRQSHSEKKGMTFRQYMNWAEKEDAKLQKQLDAAKPKASEIWNKFQTAVGNSFPDGDFIDHIGPWLRKHDLTMDDVNAAVREYTDFKDAYDYLSSMWDDHAADAEHDAMQGHYGQTYDNEWFSRPNPYK